MKIEHLRKQNCGQISDKIKNPEMTIHKIFNRLSKMAKMPVFDFLVAQCRRNAEDTDIVSYKLKTENFMNYFLVRLFLSLSNLCCQILIICDLRQCERPVGATPAAKSVGRQWDQRGLAERVSQNFSQHKDFIIIIVMSQ